MGAFLLLLSLAVDLSELPGPPWMNSVIQLGCLGIVAFGSHYILTKTIPEQQRVFLEELKEQRVIHQATEVANREAFVDSMQAQREDFRSTCDQFKKAEELVAERLHELTIAIVTNTGANPRNHPQK